MTIKPILYYSISFLVSLASCFLFVCSQIQLFSDEDYVYNYLKCGPDGDSVGIPIMGAMMVSVFFGILHVVFHSVFISITASKNNDKNFRIRLGFYKDEKIASWVINFLFYLFALFLIYDYASSFYKFYLFEFLSCFVMIMTVVLYSLTITNLIGRKNRSNKPIILEENEGHIA